MRLCEIWVWLCNIYLFTDPSVSLCSCLLAVADMWVSYTRPVACISHSAYTVYTEYTAFTAHHLVHRISKTFTTQCITLGTIDKCVSDSNLEIWVKHSPECLTEGCMLLLDLHNASELCWRLMWIKFKQVCWVCVWCVCWGMCMYVYVCVCVYNICVWCGMYMYGVPCVYTVCVWWGIGMYGVCTVWCAWCRMYVYVYMCLCVYTVCGWCRMCMYSMYCSIYIPVRPVNLYLSMKEFVTVFKILLRTMLLHTGAVARYRCCKWVRVPVRSLRILTHHSGVSQTCTATSVLFENALPYFWCSTLSPMAWGGGGWVHTTNTASFFGLSTQTWLFMQSSGVSHTAASATISVSQQSHFITVCVKGHHCRQSMTGSMIP